MRSKLFLVLCLFVGITLIGPRPQTVQAQDSPSWFGKFSAGGVATTGDWQKGEITDIVKLEGVRLIYRNLALAYQYQDFDGLGGDLGDHAALILFYTRNPQNSDKISPYFFAGGAFTQGLPESENEAGDFNPDFGLGVLFPNWEAIYNTNMFTEVGFKYLEETWIVSLSLGTHFGMEF